MEKEEAKETFVSELLKKVPEFQQLIDQKTEDEVVRREEEVAKEEERIKKEGCTEYWYPANNFAGYLI